MINSKLITRADLPNLTTIFGNIGNSWNNSLPNDLYIKGVPKRILIATGGIGNAGSALSSLHSFDLPAGTFKAENSLDIHYSGGFAANNNDKRLVFSFAGQTAYDSGLFDQDDFFWVTKVRYVCINNVTVRSHITTLWGLLTRDSTPTITGNLFLSNLGTDLPVPNLDSNTSTVLVQGQGTANDDVTQNLSEVFLTRG